MANQSSLSRQELYDRVWSVPLNKLAEEYGVPGATLAKLCERHQIPRPPAGHWTKRQAGKESPRPALVAAESPELEVVHLPRRDLLQVPDSGSDSEDADVVQALARLRLLVVRPPAVDATLHPIAERMLQGLRKAAEGPSLERDGLRRPNTSMRPCGIDVAVGSGSFERAARIVHMLWSICDEMGVKGSPVENRHRLAMELAFLGEKFHLQIREKLKQHPHRAKPGERPVFAPKYDFEPRGILELRLLNGDYGSVAQTWTDRKRAKLEDVIGDVARAMISTVAKAREYRAVQQQRENEQRQAQRVAAEKAQRRQQELNEARSLLSQVERWHAAEAVRRYAGVVQARIEANGPIQPGSQAERWLIWAGRVADRLDPLNPDQEGAFSLDELYPATQQMWGGYSQDSRPGRPTWLGGWPNRHGS